MAAPVAAWLVRLAPPHVLGTAVGVVIVLTNSRTLLRSDVVHAPDTLRWSVYAVVFLLGSAALAHAVRRHRRGHDLVPAGRVPAGAREPGRVPGS